MSKIPYAAVHKALLLMDIGDPENVRGVIMSPHDIVVTRHAIRESGPYEDSPGRIALTEEKIRIDYTLPPDKAADPVPGGGDTSYLKPEPQRAWLDVPNGQIWVESEGRLYLTGWSYGIDIIDPKDGRDLRSQMVELTAPITFDPITVRCPCGGVDGTHVVPCPYTDNIAMLQPGN